jgi:hypothetical protein
VSAARIWSAGCGRVARAPVLIAVLWLTSAGIGLMPALLLHDRIATHLGDSLEADLAADGVNDDWMHEFRAQNDPIARALRPDVVGFAAVMDNTSALADVDFPSAGVVFLGLAFVAALWFLTPGAIDRLAADRPAGSGHFLGTCGAFSGRMIRLAVVAALVYAFLFTSLHPWLFEDMFENLTRNTTVERTAFFMRLALYIVFFLIVGLFNLLFDFTKVRMVVEDRHSVVAAIVAAARFVRGNPRIAAGVYVLNVLAFAVVLAAYAAVAPGAGTSGLDMWGGFVVGEIYIAARLAVKLAFWGGEAVALQARFGCPGFVRRTSG